MSILKWSQSLTDYFWLLLLLRLRRRLAQKAFVRALTAFGPSVNSSVAMTLNEKPVTVTYILTFFASSSTSVTEMLPRITLFKRMVANFTPFLPLMTRKTLVLLPLSKPASLSSALAKASGV